MNYLKIETIEDLEPYIKDYPWFKRVTKEGITAIVYSYNYSHWFWSIFHGYQQSNQERIKESKLVTALDKGKQNAYKKLLPLLL
jgi:hypothetical protein